MRRFQINSTTNRKMRLGLELLAIGVLVLATASWNPSRADDQQAALDSWVGVWDTVADDKDKFTLTLQQTRLRLNGTYAPGNGQVRGSVYDGVLHLYWSQDGNITGIKREGKAQLKLSEDGNSFTGTSKTDGEDEEHSWTGTRQPGSDGGKAISLSGVWSGVLNNNIPLTLQLKQADDTVTGGGEAFFPGEVPTRFAIIEGKFKERTLTFQVAPTNGNLIKHRGNEQLVLLEDGKTLQGTIGGIPAVAGYVGTVPVEGRGGEAKPISFTGTWNVMMDARDAWVFEIKQNRTGVDITRVTGSFYRVDDRETRFNLKDAYVRDKTLIFDTTLNGRYLNKVGKVVMDEAGNTFKGTYAGSAMTGVLQGIYP